MKSDLFDNLVCMKVGTFKGIKCSPLLEEEQLLINVRNDGSTRPITKEMSFVNGQNGQQ